MQEMHVWLLGWKDHLEKEMATHSSILAWKVPWTEEPGRLQSLGSQSWTWQSDWVHMHCWFVVPNEQLCPRAEVTYMMCATIHTLSFLGGNSEEISLLESFPDQWDRLLSKPKFDLCHGGFDVDVLVSSQRDWGWGGICTLVTILGWAGKARLSCKAQESGLMRRGNGQHRCRFKLHQPCYISCLLQNDSHRKTILILHIFLKQYFQHVLMLCIKLYLQ